jgi:hypothetical protein
LAAEPGVIRALHGAGGRGRSAYAGRFSVFAIEAGGIKCGGGKNGWGPVGMFGVLGDRRGSGVSSAETEKLCSQFGSKNAIGPPLGVGAKRLPRDDKTDLECAVCVSCGLVRSKGLLEKIQLA